jgi:hypothetical protein
MSSYLTLAQVDLLLKKIHPNRVSVRDNLAYVEASDIKAEMNRVFGFARWSSRVTEQVLLHQEQKESNAGKPVWYVVYRTRVLLTVCAPDGTVLAEYEEGHAGDSTHPVLGEAHGGAITNSESYAFKRCAVMLGDQFGASLYQKGSREALVRWTLVLPPAEGETQRDEPTPDTNDVPVVVAESLEVPAREDTHEQSAAPVEDPDVDARALRVQDLSAQLLGASSRSEVGGLAAQIGKEKLGSALTYDKDDHALTLNALLDSTLKRVVKSAA